MEKCSFCSSEIGKGRGTMFVKDTGKIMWFCSSKCMKNMFKLKRDSRKLKWSRNK